MFGPIKGHETKIKTLKKMGMGVYLPINEM